MWTIVKIIFVLCLMPNRWTIHPDFLSIIILISVLALRIWIIIQLVKSIMNDFDKKRNQQNQQSKPWWAEQESKK